MSSDIDVSLIPERLADFEQWICWQETERDGKATKVPIKPYHTNGTPNASATESGHWRDLERSARERPRPDRRDRLRAGNAHRRCGSG
ncbi:hypothetical protein [Haloplanus litoreus]|uniref:Uncharacterized protein n=1 Tax=Haloplanus litoreus TaxID=767515 RepID=A0ABD6A4V6_9EURY